MRLIAQVISVIVAHEPQLIKSEANFMNQLQEQELHEVNEMQLSNEESSFFPLQNLEGLNWTFRKMNAVQAKLNEIQSLAKAERDRIDTWEREESKKLQSDLDFFTHHIKEYHASELARDPKAKSIKTPYGTTKSTKRKAVPEKTDEQALIAYAKENDVPVVEVVTEETLKWAELKKLLKVVELAGEQVVVDADGQVVPGVVVKPETDTFKVEVSL